MCLKLVSRSEINVVCPKNPRASEDTMPAESEKSDKSEVKTIHTPNRMVAVKRVPLIVSRPEPFGKSASEDVHNVI